MKIKEYIQRRKKHKHQLREQDVTSNLLLIVLAGLTSSVLLPLRSQTRGLGNPTVVVGVVSLLVVTMGLCIVALSDWSVTDYGLGLGVGLFVFYVLVFARFGSLSAFWIGPTAAGLLVAVVHVWIGYASGNTEEPLSGPVLSPKVGQFVVVALAGFVAFRFGSILGPLMGRAGALYPLTAGVGLLVVGYAFVRHVGVEFDAAVSGTLVVFVGVWVYAAFLTRPEFNQFGTDSVLFGRYSVDLVLQGVNPYTRSMLPAFEQYPMDLRFVTYRVDGSIVTSYSYPAGGIALFTVATELGVPNLNWVTLVFLLLTIGFLTADTRGVYKFGSVAVVLSSQEYALFSSGGVFDIIYVFVLMLGMKLWSEEAYRKAAFVVGIAFTIKQIPWLIGPYVAVWLYMDSPNWDTFRHRVRTTLSYGLAGFLLPNLPFLLTAPLDWLGGVLTPVAGGAPLTVQGSGLSLLVTNDVLYLPRPYFVLLTALVYASTVALYALWFDRVKWIAWILPSLVLLFHYRSLLNYYVYVPIVSWYAMVLRHDLTANTQIVPSLTTTKEVVTDD